MDPAAPASTAPASTEPAPAPSFLDAYRAASQPAPEATPTTEPAATGTTPATPAAPASPAAPAAGAAAPDPNEWVKGLGDYKSPDEVKAALASIDTLKSNQLTDDQRAVLKLAEDPAAWREFNELTHQDPKALTDEQALFADFKKQNAGIDDESLRVLFEQEMDSKYPGLAGAPEEAMYKAHAAKQKLDAERVRTNLTQTRDSRLAELKKGALPTQGPTPEEQEAQRTAYLDGIDKLIGSHKDGYKMEIKVGDGTLNLSVDPKDLPALKEIIANPLGSLLNEEGTALDPQKLMEFAAFRVHGRTLLADAFQAGRVGGGPQVSVNELHNASGDPIPPAVGGDGSFAGALQKVLPAQPKVKY
jgi:hypothetical protein